MGAIGYPVIKEIECFEAFSKILTKPTIVILNASTSGMLSLSKHLAQVTHWCNKLFLEKIDKWQERGLFIYQRQAYSLALNTIETLWRNTRWLSIGTYKSLDGLKRAIDDILMNYDSKYQVHFA